MSPSFAFISSISWHMFNFDEVIMKFQVIPPPQGQAVQREKLAVTCGGQGQYWYRIQ